MVRRYSSERRSGARPGRNAISNIRTGNQEKAARQPDQMSAGTDYPEREREREKRVAYVWLPFITKMSRTAIVCVCVCVCFLARNGL